MTIPDPPPQIIIKQETSLGTQVALWLIVGLLAIPLVCCFGGLVLTARSST